MTNTTTPQAPAGRISTASAAQGTFGISTSDHDTWIEPEMDFGPTTFANNRHACGWTDGRNGCPNYFPHDRSLHDAIDAQNADGTGR